jgi:DNA invertase Pin-like site-specific DNA recombinase
MLTVRGGLADVERDLIRTRTAEGGSRAKAQGQQIDGQTPGTHSGTAEGNHPAPRGGLYARRTRPQL